jgi:glycosyltransferase involved in cell wall biosynthesis
MRILLATGIYPPEIGGPATFTKGLARELTRRGHTVSVICYGDMQTERADTWSVTVISRRGGAIIRYLRYFWHVCALARKSDLLFAQGPVSDGFPATLAAFLWRKPLYMKIVGDFAWEIASRTQEFQPLDAFVLQKHSGKIGLIERIERWTVRRAKHIFVPSNYLKGIVQKWGVESGRCSVIYNASPVLPTPLQSTEEWKNTHGLQGKKILLYVGRLVPWKRLDFLLSILTRLDESFAFVIAGDGPMRAEWELQVKQKGLVKRVFFLGITDRQETAACYQAADLFVLPSSYEGLPHVVLEALSVGLPCLVSDAGGNPETVAMAPGLVRVLPLEEEEAWEEAIQTCVPHRGTPTDVQTAEQMYEAYMSALLSSNRSV